LIECILWYLFFFVLIPSQKDCLQKFILYFGHFPAPKPECTSDPECPTNLACIQERCQNPCFTTVCGTNAECNVNNHRAVCICRAGYIGDPYTICEERKFVFNLISCLENRKYIYVSNYCLLAGCKSDSECPLTQTCINRECVDPCPLERCGVNALCSARNHRAVCTCPPGYRPDPDPHIRCKQYECLTDPECPSTLACRNENCVDPCKCARFADCSARNHQGICTCQPGYTGDPYGVACTPSMFLFLNTFIYFDS